MNKTKYILVIALIFSSVINIFAGGFIIISPPEPGRIPPEWIAPRIFRPYMLETISLKVDSEIKGQYAKTSIDQVFYNPTKRRLEGYFIFPVPKGAVLKDFSMDINGKQTKAELLDATKAKKIYEDIVRKMRDPALLEYSEQSLFKARIFPIEPGQKKRIKITYTEILEKDNNTCEYIFPLNTKKYAYSRC